LKDFFTRAYNQISQDEGSTASDADNSHALDPNQQVLEILFPLKRTQGGNKEF